MRRYWRKRKIWNIYRRRSIPFLNLTGIRIRTILIVWDAFKGFMKGVLIALNSRERKMRDKNVRELQDKIKEKEMEVRKAGNKKREMI